MGHPTPRAARARRRSWALAPLAALLAVSSGPAGAGEPMPEGYPGRGRIGIEVQPMTAELREFFAAPPENGVLVVRVEEGRPADAARLRVGDVVVAAGGEPLVNPRDLVAIVARVPGGEPLALTVVRKKRVRTIEVVPDGAPASASALEEWHERIGMPAEPAAPGAEPAAGTAPGAPQPPPAEHVPLAPPMGPSTGAAAVEEDPMLPPAAPEATPVHAPVSPE